MEIKYGEQIWVVFLKLLGHGMKYIIIVHPFNIDVRHYEIVLRNKLLVELCEQDVVWVESVFTTNVTQVNLSSLLSSSSSSSSTHTHTHSTIKTLPTHWATLRPEQLSPLQCVALTEWIYIGRL